MRPENAREGVSFDLNAYLYRVKEAVLEPTEQNLKRIGNLTREQLEVEFFQKLGDKLAEDIKHVHPQSYVIFAVDGKAPRAKANQQRGRRFIAVTPEEKKVVTLGVQAPKFVTSEGKSPFETNAFTAGTPFMHRVDLFMQSWIASNREVLPPLVIYSPYTVDGEGEWKIFQYLRYGTLTPGKEAPAPIAQGIGYHCMIGKDADLNMYACLSPKNKILVIRENFNDIVNIDDLKNYVYEELTSHLTNVPLEERPSRERVIQDFVWMVFFAGNDFLPHQMSMEDMGLGMETLFAAYRRLNGNTITDSQGYLQPLVMANYVYFLQLDEQRLLINKASKHFNYPSTILESVTVREEAPPDPHFIEHGTKRKNERRYTVKSFDYARFRTLWYINALGPRTEDGRLLLQDLNVKIFDTSVIEAMCSLYTFGLQWVLQYYLGNPVTSEFIYSFHHCPLLTDLSAWMITAAKAGTTVSLEAVRPKPNEVKTNLLHLLVAVMPPASVDLLPVPLRKLLLPGGELVDMAPTKFIVEREGKDFDYQGVPILPPLNYDRVIEAVNRIMPVPPKEMQEGKDWISRRAPRVEIPFRKTSLLPPRGGAVRGAPRGQRGGFRGRGMSRERGGFRGTPRGRGEFRGAPRERGGFQGAPRGRGGFRGRGAPRGQSQSTEWVEGNIM